jgi:ABC-type transporter Mla MlaB component
VTIRISKMVDDQHTVLKVDGRLKADDLDELTRACQSAPGATALDLSELQSADRAGVQILRELVSMGAEIRGASPYIKLLLKTKS